jgi:hypothetical protein
MSLGTDSLPHRSIYTLITKFRYGSNQVADWISTTTRPGAMAAIQRRHAVKVPILDRVNRYTIHGPMPVKILVTWAA